MKDFSNSAYKNTKTNGLRNYFSPEGIIILVTLFCYWNSLNNGFVWDDFDFVARNPAIRSWSNIPSYFTSTIGYSESQQHVIYRPLRCISFTIDYSIWRLNPFGYHLVNLIIHTLNALLLFYIAKQTLSKLASLFAALIFASHPVMTESVAWVKGREDLLCVLFVLLAFYCHQNRNKDAKHCLYRHRLSLLAIIFFILALLSKEMAFTLPAIILIYDWLFRSDSQGCSQPQKIFRWGYYLSYFVIIGIYAILRTKALGRAGQAPYLAGGFYETMLSMQPALLHYYKLMIIPVGLCADYFHLPFYNSLLEPKVFLSAIVLASILSLGMLGWRRIPLFAFGILWYYTTLFPVSNVIPMVQLIAERFLYLPMVGICLAIGALGTHSNSFLQKFSCLPFFGILKKSLYIISSIIILSLCILTIQRNTDWKDELALWRKTALEHPDNARVRTNLAVALADSGNNEEALQEFASAIRLNPRFSYAYCFRAELLRKLKRYDEAENDYLTAIELDPKYLRAHNNLANLYAELKRYYESIEHYKVCVEIRHTYPIAYYNMANVYMELNDLKSAIDCYKRAVELDFNNPEYHHNLGVAYAISFQPKLARQEWETVLKLRPTDIDAIKNLKRLAQDGY